MPEIMSPRACMISVGVRLWRLEDDGISVPLTIPRQNGATDLAVKDVHVGGRRYVLCRNEKEARKGAETRTALLANLERQLAQGDKALVANAGYRRFLAAPEGQGFTIDPARIEADARLDGIFVLRTNTRMSALQVVLRYRNLLAVEQSFLAALLATRPIFHRTDAAKTCLQGAWGAALHRLRCSRNASAPAFPAVGRGCEPDTTWSRRADTD